MICCLLARRWRCRWGSTLALKSSALARPVLIAEWRWYRSRDPILLELAKRWANCTAIMFAVGAVGAVSGTVLSFELGLLWPKFMELAGAVIDMPFSLEGFAFFTEAIFLELSRLAAAAQASFIL